MDFFKYPGLRRNLLLLCYLWFGNTLIYYGLFFNTPVFDWNKCLVFIIPCFVNIPFMFLVPLLENKFGRKVMLTLPMFFTSFLAMITILIPYHHHNFITAFCSIAIVFASMVKVTVYVYTKELFPTVLRSTGFSCTSTCSRLGSVAFPWIMALAPIHPVMPVVTYGLISLLAAIGSIWIWPDTTVTKLPDTLEECEAMSSSQNRWLKCKSAI